MMIYMADITCNKSKAFMRKKDKTCNKSKAFMKKKNLSPWM